MTAFATFHEREVNPKIHRQGGAKPFWGNKIALPSTIRFVALTAFGGSL